MNQDTPEKHTKPRSLNDLQRLFSAVVMNPLTTDYQTAIQTEDGQSTLAIADQIIKSNDRLTSLKRIEIYNRQYWFRLLDCLYDDFPGMRAVLGDECFHQLSIAYLTKHQSTSYSLRNLGSRIPDFVSQNPIWSGKRYQVAVDMANFEWAQVVAFDGPAWKVLNPETLLRADPTTIKLQLQPYITLLKLSYPLDDFVLALKRNEIQRSEAGTDQAPVRSGHRVKKLPKKTLTYLAIHRFNNSLYYKRLERPAFTLLSALSSGASLAEACEQSVSQFSPREKNTTLIQQKIHEWFASWNNLDWFCVPPTEDSLEI